ncbi:MAG: hypothetical protein WCD18_27385 [Thermosynechococcaceae cyanobacterium]
MPHGSMPFERSIKRVKSTQYRMEINPQQYKAFMEGITNGLSVETASWNAGIKPKTVRSWLEKGEILAGVDLPPHSQAWQYQRFSEDHEKARAKFEALHAGNINSKAVAETPGQWTASAWMLERRRSKDYGQHYQVDQMTDKKMIELVKFIFDQSPTELFREQFAAIVQMIPRLRLSETETDVGQF